MKMESFSTFRRRRGSKRDEYTLLQDDSDGSQFSAPTNPAVSWDHSRYPEGHNKLCDKCWIQHRRSRAMKRCFDCKQNLCLDCAKRDEVKRPWWLPICIAHCMKLLLCCVYTQHSIVDLDAREHWALSREATNLNRIPRVSQESLRLRHRHRGAIAQNAVSNDNRFSNSREQLIDNDRRNNELDKYFRSKSYEEVTRGMSVHPKTPRRSISVEKINRRLIRERRQRDKIYNHNWDSTPWEQTRNGAGGVRPSPMDKNFVNKVKGKDIDIVISGSEMKLTVNDAKTPNNEQSKERKISDLRRKSKSKDKSYKPYTEEVFNKNPIWFKKDSSKNKTKRTSVVKQSGDTETSKCNCKETNIGHQNGAFINTVHHETKEYSVEEPPDQCPICLNDLPGSEARILPCSHVLHTKCLIRYLSGTDNLDFGIRCPLCKRITVVKNYYAPKELWFKEIPVTSQC